MQEREIDRMVYELYRLTEEEIAIVEGTASQKSGEMTNESETVPTCEITRGHFLEVE